MLTVVELDYVEIALGRVPVANEIIEIECGSGYHFQVVGSPTPYSVTLRQVEVV